MLDKRSVKSVGILLLILANAAVVIALILSIRNAIGKIEVGKEIETQESQEEMEEGIQEDLQEDEMMQELENQENANAIEQTDIEEDQNEGITLKQVISTLNNQNTSIIEIVLVVLGIALFIIGIVLIKFVKRIA